MEGLEEKKDRLNDPEMQQDKLTGVTIQINNNTTSLTESTSKTTKLTNECIRPKYNSILTPILTHYKQKAPN